MLFLRETEGQRLRYAGAARRRSSGACANSPRAIADETLRRHYAADMAQRLAACSARGARRRRGRPQVRARPAAARGGWRPASPKGPRLGIAGQPLPKRGMLGKPAEAPRDIVILAILVNHPALLDRHGEEVAALDFSNRALAGFRDRLLARSSEAFGAGGGRGIAAGFAAQRARILRRAAGMPVWWCVRPEADPSDADQVLRQTLALHRKARALHKELNIAEKALAIDSATEISEQNFGMLRDIKEHLADLANAEAAIEGFGALSGRKLPPV